MTPSIYALLVGINDYPAKPLGGCLTDVQAMAAYLRWFQPDPNLLNLITLTDSDATRNKVIAGFDQFKDAKPGDVCLFYFSGHGSFSPAPARFYSPTNREHQSLVCWDSRRPGGRDLMDKELAYLLWKYSIGQGKPDLRFVVITDNCHSGSATRDAFDMVSDALQERTLPPAVSVDAAHYYGVGETVNGQRGYVFTNEEGHERIQVQTGPHVHLAASRDNQTAKEDRVEGEIRGLFTYSLLKALQESRGLIGYAELIRRAELQVKRFVTDQNPLLNIEGLPAGTARNGFLRQEAGEADRTHWVTHNKQRGWCIDVGSLLGATRKDRVLLETGVSTLITEVFSEESKLFEKPEVVALDRNRRYAATLLPQQTIRFALTASLPEATKTLLEQANTAGLSLTFVPEGDAGANFRIRANGNGLFVAPLADDTPLFKEIPVERESDLASLLNDLQTFCTWQQLLTLQNPNTTLRDSDIELTVTRAVSAPDPDYDPQTFEPVANLSRPIDLTYFGDQSPGLQIHVTNRSNRELWFRPFYMGFDYGIDNRNLHPFSLAAGDGAYLTMNYRGRPSELIRLQVDRRYRELGYTEILEHLKLIVSTQPLEASVLASFDQEGLKLVERGTREAVTDKDATDRSLDIGQEEFAKDWITTSLTFRISYPAKGVLVGAGERLELAGMSVQTPAGFETRMAWSSSGQATRSLGDAPTPEQITGNAALQPFNWLTTRGDAAPLNVLELYDFTNREVVSPDNPLLLDFAGNPDADNLLVLAHDPETGLYFPAGTPLGEGRVAIHTLPDESVTERSLFGSVKIFFYKVVLSKVGVAYTHPRLALATLGNDLSVAYETDPAQIKKTLSADGVKNILLFTHGIIGDTLDMTKAARLALTAGGNPIETGFDAILTFDYENLNTSIEENARLLRERLARVGIGPDDGKRVTIIAHSMGGLITRWMVEKLRGNEFVDHLILCGTPNEGTPLADVRDAVEVLLTFAVNGVSFLKPWLFAINALGKLGGAISVSFKQMDIKTGLYSQLNDGTDPRIPYTILAGDTSQIVSLTDEMTLLKKLFTRLGRAAKYDLLDKLLFRAANDIAVSTDSILGIPGSDEWVTPPTRFTIPCDHLNYFVNSESLGVLGRVV